MRPLLALSFILVAAGIPAVATYFPDQTYAMLSVVGFGIDQTATVINAVSTTTAPVFNIPKEERNIFPPRPI